MKAEKHSDQQISDEEEARIQKMIASDPDNPEWTDDDFAKAKPFSEAFSELAEKMRRNVGGRPKSENPKVPVSIRLDQDVVAKFKATGPGWQTRMNDILRREAQAMPSPKR